MSQDDNPVQGSAPIRPQLDYARTGEARPPMYAIVLSILAAGFLAGTGAFLILGSVALTIKAFLDDVTLTLGFIVFLVVMFAAALVFLVAGCVQFAGVIRQLRGVTARDTAVERSFGLLNRPIFAGKSSTKRDLS
jgi:hypothetical protein